MHSNLCRPLGIPAADTERTMVMALSLLEDAILQQRRCLHPPQTWLLLIGCEQACQCQLYWVITSKTYKC